MKRLFAFLFLISICYQVCAQRQIFVRVYDPNGKKINKGYVLAATDSSLQIKRGGDTVHLFINNIGTIKTRRSAGHNVLIGSLIGATVLSVTLSATPTDPDAWLSFTASQRAAIGAIFGLPIGAAYGGISNHFKKSIAFQINGREENWKVFQTYISNQYDIY